MKKVITAVLFVLLVSSAAGAGEKAGADAKALGIKLNKITAEYNTDLKRVKNPKDLARAINRYADKIEKISPEIKRIAVKYKGMDDAEGIEEEDNNKENTEEEKHFQEEMGKFMADENMQKNFQKMARYFSDPAVQKALMRLNMVMSQAFGEEEDD